MKRCLLSFAALCAVSFSTAQAAQPLTAPVLASDIADRYANLIYYGSGATGMAMVVIDGNQYLGANGDGQFVKRGLSQYLI